MLNELLHRPRHHCDKHTKDESRRAHLMFISDWSLVQYRCQWLDKLEFPIQPTCLLTAFSVTVDKTSRINVPFYQLVCFCRQRITPTLTRPVPLYNASRRSNWVWSCRHHLEEPLVTRRHPTYNTGSSLMTRKTCHELSSGGTPGHPSSPNIQQHRVFTDDKENMSWIVIWRNSWSPVVTKHTATQGLHWWQGKHVLNCHLEELPVTRRHQTYSNTGSSLMTGKTCHELSSGGTPGHPSSPNVQQHRVFTDDKENMSWIVIWRNSRSPVVTKHTATQGLHWWQGKHVMNCHLEELPVTRHEFSGETTNISPIRIDRMWRCFLCWNFLSLPRVFI